jgi:hypothetical protein
MAICGRLLQYSSRATKVPLRGLMLASVVVTMPASLAWAQQRACTADNPCPAGQICVFPRPDKPIGQCVPVTGGGGGPPTTTVGQALVSIGNVTYEFAVNTDNGHVLYTQWQLGGGGQGWQDLGPISASVTATTAPAGAVGNYIFVTVTGSDHNIYLNQGTPPNWVGWR